MSLLWTKLRRLFRVTFSLSEDAADEQVIVDSIRKDVSFKGTNVWTLIFAIFIASIGLNVNSTAVIIGAMLISPLMGPIMGIGLSIAINDLELLKKGAKNLAIASLVSIGTSFLYFKVTPLHEASSELLARTTPSVWDVFIAFLGGLAGIVAGTRKAKNNVIPGVAIATALMPPLCTTGYGLATGQWYYSLGALYLFFINSLFICLATFLIVKRLKFHKVEFSSRERERKVSRYFIVMVVLTVLPSIYLAYRIVQKSIFEANADKYVLENFHFAKTQVVTKKYVFDGKKRAIELLLVGEPLDDIFLDSMRNILQDYKLAGTKLIVFQGLDAKQQIDLAEIKASVLEQVYAQKVNEDSIGDIDRDIAPVLRKELRALYPDLKSYSLSDAVIFSTDSIKTDTVTLFIGRFDPALPLKERARFSHWMKERLSVDSVKVILE